MLHVMTRLGPSKIHGIGLFAAEFIPKGTVVWTFTQNYDLLVSAEDVDSFSTSSRKQFFNYAYFDKTYKKYVLCGDDARFFNHSKNPSCTDAWVSGVDTTYAARDIEKGEELTSDYGSYYGNIEDYPELNAEIRGKEC